jgi:hypothetical protein
MDTDSSNKLSRHAKYSKSGIYLVSNGAMLYFANVLALITANSVGLEV